MQENEWDLTRRDFLKTAGIAGLALGAAMSGLSLESCKQSSSSQTGTTTSGGPVAALDGGTISQFVDPLPNLHTITAGQSQIELHMNEFQYNMLPTGFKPQSGNYSGTWVWGYQEPTQTVFPSYIGPVVVATRGTPTQIKFVNNLGATTTTKIAAYKNSTDQTIHWADPLNNGANAGAHSVVPGAPPVSPWNKNYSGPIPAAPHLHGGETPPVIDGGPMEWFTSDGKYHGPTYYSGPGGGGNSIVFRYPNSQEAAPLWFHEHTLGITRIGVYNGLAGAYFIVDPNLKLPANLPGPADIVPLVIQDRMFDVNGQLYFPTSIPSNPEHPFWVPMTMGDTIVVNGKAWPYLNVDPKRYRFLFLNGSNARTYHLSLPNNMPMYIIGTDGGYLDAPARVTSLLIQPGERYEVIIDFAGSQGNNVILKNDANLPYPFGAAPPPTTLGSIIQFRVNSNSVSDTSYDPVSGMPLRSSGQTMVRLSDPVVGTIAAGVTVTKTRALTLNEVVTRSVTINGKKFDGGTTQVLVNNTRWDGMRTNTATGKDEPLPGSVSDGFSNYLTETPNEGETEVWEIINLTTDAHPIHIHPAQFQILNRQGLDVGGYTKDYSALFPSSEQIDPQTGLPYAGGKWIDGYGAPLSYTPSSASGGTYGGNPDITPYLQGSPQPPPTFETGWKDTVVASFGMVTRLIVRWAPTDKALNDPNMYYPFDPSAGGRGYVWHCHIIDHEDNEMMRPHKIVPATGATRTYVMGTDY